MRTSAKALITTLVLEAASLCGVGIAFAVGDVSYKSGQPDHLLFVFGEIVHLPGVFVAAMAGLHGGPAFWIVAVLVTLPCWFLFWLIVYEGMAGARVRWKPRSD